MIDIEINSLPDYLEKVFSNKLEEFHHEVADLKTMYRGQGNIEWGLLPSAFRTRDDFLNEHFYIREYERQLPKECAGKSSIEILIDAQHFGIPTRLLDITSNPLVALYFACSESETKDASPDGVVFQFAPAGIFMQYDLSCSVYAEYVRRYKDGVHFSDAWKKGLIESAVNSDSRFSFEAPKAVGRMLSEKPSSFFMLPRYSNDRISAQEGAFLLCGTPFVEKPDPGYGKGVFLFPDEMKQDFKSMISHRYIIPAEFKGKILCQLDSVGINEAKLFPDIEHRVKSIVSSVRREGRVG